MTPSTCPVCGAEEVEVFSATVLVHHEALYVHCPGCDLIRIRDPHWLDEAYAAPMSAIDTGVAARNIDIARRLGCLYAGWFGLQARVADFAGGHGLLTRLLRDQGFDCVWNDPFTKNEFARGFEFAPGDVVAAVSAVEALEHVLDPLDFLRVCLADSGAQAVVFTTQLYEGAPPDDTWWYYQRETGQHITFMTRRTLEIIAETLGCRLWSRGTLHALTLTDLPSWPFLVATSPLRRAWHPVVSRRWSSLTAQDSERAKAAVREGLVAQRRESSSRSTT